MFDPFSQCCNRYYLVNDSLKTAALPQRMWVMNWNSGKKAESLQHFEQLGHHQMIAGYYDAPAEQINDWLDAVKENMITLVQGVMYTTLQ